MLSNKLTFSLVCFIMLFAFVALPVMAHDDMDGDDTTHPRFEFDTSGATPVADDITPAHALVTAITIEESPVLITSGTGRFINVIVEFAPKADGTVFKPAVTTPGSEADAEGAHATLDPGPISALRNADFVFTREDEDGSFSVVGRADASIILESKLETRAPAAGVGAQWHLIFTTRGNLNDGKFRMNLTGGDPTQDGAAPPALPLLPRIGNAGGTHVYSGLAAAQLPTYTVDTAAPTISNLVASAIGENYATVDGHWGSERSAFNINFDMSDISRTGATFTGNGSGLDLSTLEFKAEPDNLSFGTARSRGPGQYVVAATPKGNFDVATEVTVTISVKDKVDIAATAATLKVTLAPNPAPPVTVTPEADAVFSKADPADGDVLAGKVDAITVTFDKDPGTVTADVGTVAAGANAMERKITVPAGQAGGALAIKLTWGTNGSQTLDYNILAPLGDGTITILPNSFVVVTRGPHRTPITDNTDPAAPVITGYTPVAGARGVAFRSTVTTDMWPEMPDLQDLFDRNAPHGGGALVVTGADIGVGTVGISEIMWARDSGYFGDEAAEKASQWIELHNLNNVTVKVSLKVLMGNAILDEMNGLRGDLAAPNIDAVTNFFNNRPGHGAWDVKGSEGDSVNASNFVSMARILPDKKSKYENADGARYNNRDGRNAGHWVASTAVYLRARTAGNVDYNYIGTPGLVNSFKPAGQTDLIAGRTSVPSNTIVINEVGNRSDDRYDWIELRNASGGEINLRNYMISILKAVDDDKPLIQFPANDSAKVAAGAVILLVATDPASDSDHPIAVGYNVDKPAQEQVSGRTEQGAGSSNTIPRYKVFGELNLPNDGKFVLIVRRPDNGESQRSGADGGKGVAETGNADLDKVVDIAGWDDDLAKSGYPNSVSNTSLWPLHNFAGPFTDRNSFKENTVHRRQYTSTNDGRSGVGAHENKNQDDRAAFRDIGWTGVGYKRNTAPSNAHGGTPGYDNGVLKGSGGDITGPVYISEIMYADNAQGIMPQWIEIRNPSKTAGADLHNWRLTITNHDVTDDAGGLWEGKAEASVLLNGLKIKPNSSVIVTSRKGPRSDVYLAAADIFSLYPVHRGTFGMNNPGDNVINPYGFKITLNANGHEGDRNKWQLVDEVSNLADASDRRGNRERFDAPRWAWPDANAADGSRISVARITHPVTAGNKHPRMHSPGTMAASWILSSVDTRAGLTDFTYYGHSDDVSTPGQTYRSPLPVSLSFFRPTLEDGKIVIRWTTESELDNAGFNIYRSDTRDGEFKQVNEALIQGKGTTAERSSYKWIDATAKPGAVYYYQIEDVSFAGERNTLTTTKLKGLISAKDKLTTRWGELKEVQ